MSMNKLANSMSKRANETATENGAYALKSTGYHMVDLFSRVGSMRTLEAGQVLTEFDCAFNEDNLLATKLMFYARDIREGLGERKTFRIILKDMAERHPEIVEKNIELIGLYGRFDDLYELVGTPVEKQMWQYMRKQLDRDYADMKAGKNVSLLAKWIKLPDSKSKVTSALGSKTMNGMGFRKNRIEGIKMVKELRKYLEIPEIAIAAKEYSTIDYSKIASQCMKHYKGAFAKNDSERFTKFMNDVRSGKATVNAGAITPVEIVKSIIESGYSIKTRGTEVDVAEAQWKALPNYAGDKNILVMADTSGSMTWNGGDPMATSISLALYFAERNEGAFKNMFMTFSSEPEIIEVDEHQSLSAKLSEIMRAPWGNNTDFEAAYRLILNLAVKNHVPAKDMPEAIVVISDMQFDTACYGSNNRTYVAHWRDAFEEHGYTVPRLVFWNVNSAYKNTQASKDDIGVTLLSGSSATQFKSLVNTLTTTPEEYMLEVLNSERYEAVRV